MGGVMSQEDTGWPKMDPAQEIANSILDQPVILFSGQGAQEAGMGRDLAEAESWAMDYWKQAEKISNLPLREIYWDGDESAMSSTAALQPALTVTNFNLWREFEKRSRIRPFAFAGHSLGEFTALGAAGVLEPADLLRITSLRGRLMAEADPEGNGAMAAVVRLTQDVVEKLVNETAAETGEVIVAANFNTPSQVVVSGSRNAIRVASQKARDLKGRSVELKVSGAFHSPLMEEANRELSPLLEKTQWHEPRCPVYSNVTAQPLRTGEEAKKSILKQMISPVFWVDLIRRLYLAGIRWWMEISPRAVLGKMVGPSLAGLAGYVDNLRVELLPSLSSVVNYTF